MDGYINFYEVEFANGYSICIKGVREPSLEEAKEFCGEDAKRFGTEVINVIDIEEAEARSFFDLDNVDNWPVFGT